MTIAFATYKPSISVKILRGFTRRFSKWNIIKKIDNELGNLIRNSEKFETNKVRIFLFLISLGIWLMLFVFFYFLFLSIKQDYSIWEVLFATTLANFSWILPINGVGGFGTMEVSMAFAFSMRGYVFNELLVYALYINVTILILSTLFAVVPFIKLLGKGNKSETNCPNSMSE